MPRPQRHLRLASVIAVVATIAAGCGTNRAAARPAAFPGARPTGASSATRSTPYSLALAVVQSALSLRGQPYRPGGASPESGFDCSGLVAYVMRQHDVVVPRTVGEQFRAGVPVSPASLMPGDLVFFSTTGPGPTHVGIVIPGEGRLEFVHAPADGAAVRAERFDTSYWQRRWVGARRVLSPVEPATGRLPARSSGSG